MPASASPPPTDDRQLPSLPQLLGRLFDALPGVVGDRVHLLTLELRRASRALAKVVVLGLAAALLAITAWIALWIGMAAAAITQGVHWGWVAVASVLLNGVLAALAVRKVMALAPLLGMPATVRRLTRGPGDADRGTPRGTAP